MVLHIQEYPKSKAIYCKISTLLLLNGLKVIFTFFDESRLKLLLHLVVLSLNEYFFVIIMELSLKLVTKNYINLYVD